ncbi:hypothetical protein YC2023_033374 [Brassica napus]
MDPEQTFIRVQERFSQILKPRVRAFLEYSFIFVAITLFCILVVIHANYGYFLLPDEAKSWHNIRTANVIYTISKQESFTILVTPKNFLKDLRNLEHYVGMEDMIKAALVALATFSLVQYKHLQHHAQHRLPTFQLIFVHVIESLVFVPVCTHICNGPVPGPKILIKDWASLRPIWQRHRVSLHLFYKKRCSLPFASYKT